MKKARLMLSALGICAVLATTFAFSAQKFNKKVIFTGTSSTDCTHEVQNRTITTDVGTLIFASTASISSGCTQTYTAVPANNN